MRIAEVLRLKGKEVATIHSFDKVVEAVRKLDAARIGALVVTDRWGKLVGMFSERDMMHALAAHGGAALEYEVHELMTPEVTTCSAEDRIEQIMSVMTAHRIRHLPVMAEGHIIGIVSMGDLVKHRLDEKEQEANVLRDITRALA